MGLPVNHAAENALATLGAVLWSIQIIPQLVLSYRTKSTKGLSENLMLYVQNTRHPTSARPLGVARQRG